MNIYSIWAKAKNDSLKKAKEIINEISQKEESTSFNPHVTLVTNMYSLEKAEEVFEKLNKKKIIVNFDAVGTGYRESWGLSKCASQLPGPSCLPVTRK